jgi:hypothetical protein
MHHGNNEGKAAFRRYRELSTTLYHATARPGDGFPALITI